MHVNFVELTRNPVYAESVVKSELTATVTS